MRQSVGWRTSPISTTTSASASEVQPPADPTDGRQRCAISWHGAALRGAHAPRRAGDRCVARLDVPCLRADAARRIWAVGWGQASGPRRSAGATTAAGCRAGITAALPWGFTVGGERSRCAGRTTRATGSSFTQSDVLAAERPDPVVSGERVQPWLHGAGGFSPQVSLVREDRTSAMLSCTTTNAASPRLRFVRLF